MYERVFFSYSGAPWVDAGPHVLCEDACLIFVGRSCLFSYIGVLNPLFSISILEGEQSYVNLITTPSLRIWWRSYS